MVVTRRGNALSDTLSAQGAQAPPDSSYDVVIVGAGQAGGMVAVELRAQGFVGTIALVGDETELPYERPPLSKAYLMGQVSADQLLLRDEEFWKTAEVSLVLGSRVVSVDADAHAVTVQHGWRIGYSTLVWATGGRPRRLDLPAEHLDGVHVLRIMADAERLRAALTKQGSSLVVIGAGFVGLEAAAVFSAHGHDVTVIELQDRVLQRVAGAEISEHVHRVHEGHGVTIRLRTQVVSLSGDDRHVTGVQVVGADGAEDLVKADHVLVAVGLVPNIEVLEDAGAQVADGVLVDATGRTSLPDVFAVGDCANLPYALHPRGRVRLESVQGANDLAKVVAAEISGTEPRPFPTPWFWSNQYDLKHKTVGLSAGHDRTIRRGDPSTGSFSILYLKDDLLLAVDTINHMRDYVGARPVVGQRLHLDRAADPDTRLADAVVDA
jgi:3-phenylpropionate/trans-cinnamate dioxygenase ferredoxin reductase subunit